MGADFLRALKMDPRGIFDAKPALRCVTIIEPFGVMRMRDPVMEMTPAWKEIRG